jgi:hypothetical protein
MNNTQTNNKYGIAIIHTCNWTKVSKLPTPKYQKSGYPSWTAEEIKEYSKPLTVKEEMAMNKVCAMYTPEEIQRIARPFKNEGERIAFKEWLSQSAPSDQQAPLNQPAPSDPKKNPV